MAVINKETKKKIASKLVSDKYDSSIKSINEEISKIIENNYFTNTPTKILESYNSYPDYFHLIGSVRIYFNEIYNFVNDDSAIDKNMYQQYYSFTFSFKKMYPCNNSLSTKNILERIVGENYKDLKKLFIKYLKLSKEKDILNKKLNCLMEETTFTENRLKNDFPEAYKVYLNIKNETVPDNNVCDSIENIRATLK